MGLGGRKRKADYPGALTMDRGSAGPAAEGAGRAAGVPNAVRRESLSRDLKRDAAFPGPSESPPIRSPQAGLSGTVLGGGARGQHVPS